MAMAAMITTMDLAAFAPVPMNVTVELPCRREGGTLARIAPTGDQRGAGLPAFKAARHCGMGTQAPAGRS